MEINRILRQFAQTIKEFKKTFEFSDLMVADAALYTRVRASQSGLTKGFENADHIIVIHRSSFLFLP